MSLRLNMEKFPTIFSASVMTVTFELTSEMYINVVFKVFTYGFHSYTQKPAIYIGCKKFFSNFSTLRPVVVSPIYVYIYIHDFILIFRFFIFKYIKKKRLYSMNITHTHTHTHTHTRTHTLYILLCNID